MAYQNIRAAAKQVGQVVLSLLIYSHTKWTQTHFFSLEYSHARVFNSITALVFIQIIRLAVRENEQQFLTA